MTMVIFFHTTVESCEGGHGTASREEEAWPSSSKREGSMTMAIFLPSRELLSVMADLLKKRSSALPIPKREEG
jgi:hypothetical protein